MIIERYRLWQKHDGEYFGPEWMNQAQAEGYKLSRNYPERFEVRKIERKPITFDEREEAHGLKVIK